MISLTLFALAILWLVFLRQYPWLFARRQTRSVPGYHYHYYVCGSADLPTWQRKGPGPTTPKTTRAR
jgi:hypothetical protein